jgi:hypothetical protein
LQPGEIFKSKYSNTLYKFKNYEQQRGFNYARGVSFQDDKEYLFLASEIKEFGIDILQEKNDISSVINSIQKPSIDIIPKAIPEIPIPENPVSFTIFERFSIVWNQYGNVVLSIAALFVPQVNSIKSIFQSQKAEGEPTMSNFLSLSLPDYIKGVLVAAFSAVLSGIYNIIQAGSFPTAEQWHNTLMVAITAAIAYLMKNFLTNSNGVPLTPEDKQSK